MLVADASYYIVIAKVPSSSEHLPDFMVNVALHTLVFFRTVKPQRQAFQYLNRPSKHKSFQGMNSENVEPSEYSANNHERRNMAVKENNNKLTTGYIHVFQTVQRERASNSLSDSLTKMYCPTS